MVGNDNEYLDHLGRKRVVVTGLGVVTCLGTGVEEFWNALISREYGIRPLTRFDTSSHKITQGGEARGIELQSDKDPAVLFIETASREASMQAGLLEAPLKNPLRGAIVLGTNFGAMDYSHRCMNILAGVREGKSVPNPDEFAKIFRESANSYPAEAVAQSVGFEGIRNTGSLSCASGNASVGYAAQLIRSDEADVAIAGGFDSISELSWSGLAAIRTMTNDMIRPFDKRRNGTIFSEGAGAIVLESLESARKRGAEILAEFGGFWMNNNAYHMAHPDKGGEGVIRAMRKALEDAGLEPDQIDHVNAHGTATKYNDSIETGALKKVFGECAYDIPVNSIKSMVGHVMGAASAVEAVCSMVTLMKGVIPPTINLEESDPECDLDYVTDGPREVNVRNVLSNSSGIGGPNCVVVFRKYD